MFWEADALDSNVPLVNSPVIFSTLVFSLSLLKEEKMRGCYLEEVVSPKFKYNNNCYSVSVLIL